MTHINKHTKKPSKKLLGFFVLTILVHFKNVNLL